MLAVTHHPSGVHVEIVGIGESNRERSCEVHKCSGKVIALDTVLRLRKVQIINDQNVEETAIAAYWVTDGIDRCRVGFLPRHCLCQAVILDGHLVQVVAMLANSESPSEGKHSLHNRGICYATIIDTKVTHVINRLNERTQTLNINALASSILAGGVESDNEVAEYVGDKEEQKEADNE